MGLRADQHLFLSYLVLITLVTVAMSFGAESLLRRHFLATAEADLRRELQLGGAFYDGSGEPPSDALAQRIGALSGRRVTIIGADGSVLGESNPTAVELPRTDDYRIRPEVRGALATGEGSAVRYSSTLREEHLYVAQRTRRGELLRFAVPLSEIDVALSQAQRGIIGVGIGAVLLAGLFSLGFSIAVTRPLRRMGEAARALAAGDLGRRIEVQHPRELRELGAALNSLADQLQRRLSQLEGERAEMQTLIDSMSEGVLAVAPNGTVRRMNPAARRIFSVGAQTGSVSPETISRRPEFLRLIDDAIHGESVPAREITVGGAAILATAHPLPNGGAVLVFLDISQLRRLEGVRRDFVANASHELKTPLTAIRGYSETLLDEDLPPDLRQRFTEIIKLNADRLQRIVEDLLDLSRIEGGGWPITPTEVDLSSLAEAVWQAENVDGNEIELRFDLAPGHERVWADPEAMRQVLSNLFSNSVRYTPPGGFVQVRTRSAAEMPDRSPSEGVDQARAEGWTVVEVEDSGTGIPSPHLSRIFERFYRADPARSRVEGGTGLGLAIVKHLVELHGGSIEALSEVGRGTIIRFTLPPRDRGIGPGAPADAVKRRTGTSP